MAATVDAAGGIFTRERLQAFSDRYAARHCDKTVASHIALLESSLAESQQKYINITLHSALTQPFATVLKECTHSTGSHGRDTCSEENSRTEEAITENGNHHDSSMCRDKIVDTLTWEEVSRAACRLADDEYLPRSMTVEKLQAAAFFPQFLATDNVSRGDVLENDDHAYRVLLMKPYLTQYHMMQNTLVELGRAQQGRQNELSTVMTNVKIDLFPRIVPSKWMCDFLNVFSRASQMQNVEGYPYPVEMEDVFYTTKLLSVYPQRNEHGNGMEAVEKKMQTYAYDIGYHCVRFASLFTTLYFTPRKGLAIGKRKYTDIELLLHYAMRTTENRECYKDFLRNPSCYLTSSKHDVLVSAVEKAVKAITLSFNNGLMFKPDGRYGLELLRTKGKIDGDGEKTESAPVPREIMTGLALDILNNIVMYERLNGMAQFSGTTKVECTDTRLQSPIGLYLNFDERSVEEFEKLYRRLCPQGPSSMNAQMSIHHIENMKCVKRIYAMLVSAAFAFYVHKNVKPDDMYSDVDDQCQREKCERKPHSYTSLCISRCVQYDEKYKAGGRILHRQKRFPVSCFTQCLLQVKILACLNRSLKFQLTNMHHLGYRIQSILHRNHSLKLSSTCSERMLNRCLR